MNYLIRAIIAVVAYVIVTALIPPLFTTLSFHPTASLMQVLNICIGGIALLYVVAGPALPPWKS